MDLSKLLSGLGIDGKNGDNKDLLKQAENMWKMLDDLADNNPDGYKSFISSNMEQGKQVMDEEREAKVKEFTRKIEKDSFKVTVKIDFKLKPRIDTSDLKAPTSVLLNEKLATLREYKGSVLLSIFSIKDQKPELNPSFDHFNFRFENSDICCSVCAALCPSSANGMIANPMTVEAKNQLSIILGMLHEQITIEIVKSKKKPQDMDLSPKIYYCELIPSTLGKVNGFAIIPLAEFGHKAAQTLQQISPFSNLKLK